MKNLFVKESDEVKIHLFIGLTEKGGIVADPELSTLEEEGIDAKSVEEHDIVFRMLNFKDSVALASDMFNYSAQEQGLDFNPLAMRFEKIVKLIKSWTFKDDAGNILPCTKENISNLHPTVASAIGAVLDAQVPSL